jgi:signal transduction histidine kinase
VHDAIEARQPVLVQDREVLGTRYPGLAPVAARAGAAALVAVPLVADGGPPLGALLLVLGTRHAPAGGDLPFLRAVAQQCAQAVVRVRLYEAERRARLEAVAAHRTKSEFLATMSHELRTPLNAITGYLQLLELEIAGPLTARQRAYLGRLGASGQHLLALINDILDLSRLDAGRMPLARERALAGHTLDAALILVLPQARERGVRIVDACQRAVPGASAGVPYVGDEDRVRQVLVNLLSNAVKFTPAGGTITVDCALADDAAVPSRLVGGGPWTVLRVTDTGIGIAPEHQTAIFEPFRQVEGGHTRRAEGTGLGLAISRRLARLMGGDLMVESRPGAGATFSLWLPAPGEAAATSGEPTAATLAAVAAPPAPRSVESDDARGARALGDGEPDEGPGALASIGHALRASLPTVLDTARSRLRADPVTRDVSIPLGRAELDNHQLAFLADVVHTLLVLDDTRGEESDQLRDGGALQRLTSAQHGRMRHRRGWREEHLAREYAIVAEELTAVAWRAAAEAGVAHADAELAVAVLARLLGRAHDIATMAMRRARENAEMREG